MSSDPMPFDDPTAQRIHARKRLLGLENEFVICNPTPDAQKIGWGGETLFVPPRHIAVPPHPKFQDVKHSYPLPDGSFLKGTLMIRDLKEIGPLGEELINWSSTACVRAKIGLEFTGEYGLRGLFWLPTGFDMEEFELESQAGLLRWQEMKLEDARCIVHEIETQIAVHRERNMAPPLPPPAYEEAKAMLVAAADRMQVAFSQIMVSRGRQVSAGAEEAASFREAREAMGLPLPLPGRVEAMASAQPIPAPHVVVDKESLVRELLSDPVFLAMVRGAVTVEPTIPGEQPVEVAQIDDAPTNDPPGTLGNKPSKQPRKK